MALFILFLPLYFAVGAVELSFEALKNWRQQDEQVQLRGFAYETPGGEWILSSDPHLKSCCIGSVAKADQQVVLHGLSALPGKGKVVVVEGMLSLHLERETGRYTMDNPRIIENASYPWLTLSLGTFFLIAIAGYILKARH